MIVNIIIVIVIISCYYCLWEHKAIVSDLVYSKSMENWMQNSVYLSAFNIDDFYYYMYA